MYSTSASRSVTTLGVPSTSASMLAENVLCIAVSLKSLFRITRPCAPDLNSITIRIPLRSDSSRISEMPSSLLLLTKPAIFSINVALLTW